MKSYLSRLSSLERRFVVGVMVVVILIINVLFVWPRFKDWNELKVKLNTADNTLKNRETIISQSKKLEADVKILEQEGAPVPQEDQVIEFLRTINSQGAQSGVNITANVSLRQNTGTNQFFVEQVQALTIVSGEQQLVDFLYKLGEGSSLIRVRDLLLRPDAPHYQLTANLKLVASYQKKTAVRSSGTATNSPTARPAPPTNRRS